MSLSLIVAMTQNRVIGDKGKVPWHIPEDLAHFKKITMGHTLIMGRKTFDSIGRPLPGRKNIVLTHNRFTQMPGVSICNSLEDAIEEAGDTETFVIGGGEIYRIALSLADKIYVTLIEKDIPGDSYFPEINFEEEYELLEEGPVMVSEKQGIPYKMMTWARLLPSAA